MCIRDSNGADSVHWSFIYIYIKELPIYKKESGCIPPRLGDTLLDSRFDFENLTQSEAREPPTSGHKSVMEGPTMVLTVSIGLLFYIHIHKGITNIQEGEWLYTYPRLGDTLLDSRFDFENQTQFEAREPPTSGHKSVMEGPRILLIVSIGL